MDRTVAWRRSLLTLCAFSFACLVAAVVLSTREGARAGVHVQTTEPAFVDHIVVSVHSGAYRAGLRTGDTIDRRLLTAPNRFRFANAIWPNGSIVALPVQRNGKMRWINVRTFQPQVFGWQYWLGVSGCAWCLIFATILSLRRADSWEARLLALLLLLTTVASQLFPNNWITAWPVLDAWAQVVSYVLFFTSLSLLTAYAALFARPLSRTRRLFTWSTYGFAAISIVYSVAGAAGQWYGTLDPVGPVYGSVVAQLAISVPGLVLPLCCAFLAIRESHGLERTRLTWAAVPLAIYILGQLAASLLYTLLPAMGDTIPNLIGNATIFLAPLGLTYSLLSRKLLDIGFALNRAAVFAATTLLIAGLFSSLQWASNSFVSGVTHTHNVLVQLLIALVTYYIVRLSRTRTEAVVTSLFFAQRERRIEAIRELAIGVDDVAAADDIGAFVVAQLRSGAAVEAVVLLQADSGDFVPANGSPPSSESMGAADATIAALSSRRTAIPLPQGPKPGTMAYPMLIRGRLRGVLICAPPDDDGTFAPDEGRALLELATKMASARDDLLAESLRDELRAFRAQFAVRA
jgi:hypothetical protein